MKEYTVYFDLFGKKMQTSVYAPSEEAAKEIIRSKVTFHKVEEQPEGYIEILEMLKLSDLFK